MHAAHPVVGVSRSLSIFRPAESEGVPVRAERAQPLTVALVSGELDGQVAATFLGFQRMLQGRLDAKCCAAFLDLAEGVTELAMIGPADCTVLLYQGITILRDRSQWEPETAGGGGVPRRSPSRPAEIAVIPLSKRHPVLRGVAPFVSRAGMPVNPQLPAQALCLLEGQENDQSLPVAWVRDRAGQREFHTSLGGADDFRQSSFSRLLVNAITWVAGS